MTTPANPITDIQPVPAAPPQATGAPETGAGPITDIQAVGGAPAPTTPAPAGGAPAPTGKLPDTGTTLGNMAVGMLSGVGEGVLDTTSGIGSLIQKIPVVGPKIIPQSGLAAEKQIATGAGTTSEAVGRFGETAAEWLAGEEGLSALGELPKAAQFLKSVTGWSEYLKNSPKVIKLINSLGQVAKQGLIGGVQGGIKGAAEDNAVAGAEGGAAGGAIGGAIGEALPTILSGTKFVAKTLGIGLDSTEAMTKAAAGSLRVGTQNWEGTLDKAMPLLVKAEKSSPVTNVGSFVDLIHDTATNLWQNVIQPQVDRHADEMIDPTALGAKIRSAITRPMVKFFPEEAEAIEKMAAKIQVPTTVAETAEDLQTLNAKLQKFYQASPEAKAAIVKTDGDVAALEATADGMREMLYDHLKAAGEKLPGELRQQYGALKKMESIFGKREIVADRQAPLNIQQALAAAMGSIKAVSGEIGSAAAVTTLLPLAVVTAAKIRNAPESLIRLGLKAFMREQAGPGVIRQAVGAIGTGAQRLAAPAGSAIGQAASEPETPEETGPISSLPPLPEGHSHFMASDQSEHYIPTEHLDTARGIDPDLQVLRSA